MCKITLGSDNTACDYYVKYSDDGGSTWKGLTFGGAPGGTGCPNTKPTTMAQTLAYLKDKNIDQG